MDTSQELDSDAWLAIGQDLDATLPPTTFIALNGGEPLLRKDLALALISRCKQYFHTVSLNSNGSTLDKQTITELEQSRLDSVTVSLYSLDPDIHDSLRESAGSSVHARQAIETLLQTSIKPVVGILVTSRNLKTIPALIDWLESLEVSYILQVLDEVFQSEPAKDFTTTTLVEHLWPDRQDVEQFAQWLGSAHRLRGLRTSPSELRALLAYYRNPRAALRYRCFVGQEKIVINPVGDLAFCYKQRPLGNICSAPLCSILTTATRERHAIKTCPKYCRILGCNFHRGLSEWIRT
jgi:MoaA/NifB/PqqE/SkfB family radical SAM enzyme